MTQETPYIFDATTADFDQSVIANSFHKPVLVDFWAEWCAPCKALMPMLQTIAESYQGELLLAKVNCDIEQDIVARFGIRSLPTVVLFKDGQPVDGFAGAQPESAVRTMLEPHVQMPPPAAPTHSNRPRRCSTTVVSPTPKPCSRYCWVKTTPTPRP